MQKDYKRQIDVARKADIDDMAESRMSDKTRRQARHRPYCCDMGPTAGVARLIRAQGEQIVYGVEDALKKWGVDMERKIGDD